MNVDTQLLALAAISVRYFFTKSSPEVNSLCWRLFARPPRSGTAIPGGVIVRVGSWESGMLVCGVLFVNLLMRIQPRLTNGKAVGDR